MNGWRIVPLQALPEAAQPQACEKAQAPIISIQKLQLPSASGEQMV